MKKSRGEKGGPQRSWVSEGFVGDLGKPRKRGECKKGRREGHNVDQGSAN